MNFSFLNSLFLFGLIAAIIPILIHLFIKYKPKIIYFSSLRFLKEVQKKKSRLLHLRELLLLITRILIIILFILALARPVMKALLPQKSTSHAPTAIALIVDNSYSMNYLEKDKPVFEIAKQKAQNVLDLLNDNDRVMLVTLDPSYNASHASFGSPSQAVEDLSKLRIADNTKDIKEVLKLILPELSRADMINKEIYIITDEQRILWQDIEGIELTEELLVIPADVDSAKQNVSTTAVRYVPGILSETNNPVIKATVKNNSPNSVSDVIVSLVLNNTTRAETALDLNPYQSRELTFDVPDQGERFHFGEVRVKDEMLPDDNVFYFNFSVQSNPKICVISTKEIPSSLSSILDVITHQQWEQITPQEINEQALETNELFIIYASSGFDEKMSFYADQILEKGKALFLIPNGNMHEYKALNEWLIGKGAQYTELKKQFAPVDFVNNAHPICAMLNQDHLQSTDINKIWQVKAADFVPLLSTDNGNPVLMIDDDLLLSSIDYSSDWSNIIYQTVFPVLFYNIGYYLGDKSSEITQYTVGTQPSELDLEGEFLCQLPDGEKIPLDFAQNKNSFIHTNQQGHYFMYDEYGLVKVLSYNAQRDESDLSILSSAQKEQIMNDIQNVHFLTEESWEANILTSRYGYEFWKQLLWIVLALLVIEMILAYSGKGLFKK